MKIGIIGLDQSGKTTLFHALTQGTAGHAGGKKDANVSVVKVPDSRLDRLHELFPTARKVEATIEYLDVTGLSKGSTQRKGFQEQFLATIRNIDALVCVLRRFQDEMIPHSEGGIDPARDWTIIQDEFLFSDLSILENRIVKLEKDVKKTKDDVKCRELAALQKSMTALEAEKPLRIVDFDKEEAKILRGFQFLTAKPILLVLNVGEDELADDQLTQEWQAVAAGKNVKVLSLSAKIEMEIAQLEDDDKMMFQEELGINEPAVNKMIRHSYDLLGLVPFFTAGEKEVRAWTIKKNTRAQNAAGAIHSDIERGFIRAEVVEFEKLSELGSFAKCKEQGVLRLEGKEYIVQDGDVITYRFNV